MEMPTPDIRIMNQKSQIVQLLQEVLPKEAVIFEPRELHAYECDALTAYK